MKVLTGIYFFLIIFSIVSSEITDSKEFSLNLIHLKNDYKNIEEFYYGVIKILLEIKKNGSLNNCEFDFSSKKLSPYIRGDILFDTKDGLLEKNQAKLRFRSYTNKDPDLTFKYSSLLEKLAEKIDTEASDIYDSKNKMEQNLYGWDIYSRNFFHKSSKIVDLEKWKNVWDGWSVQYIDNFFPKFDKVFQFRSDDDVLYPYKETDLIYTDGDIEISLDDNEMDLDLEYGYSNTNLFNTNLFNTNLFNRTNTINNTENISMDKYLKTKKFDFNELIKIELSWKVKKDKKWNDQVLSCSLQLLEIFQKELLK